MAAFHPLRIARREQLTDDAVALTLQVPGELAERFRYAAGQHLTIRHHDVSGAELRRTYSVCAPPRAAARSANSPSAYGTSPAAPSPATR